MNNEIQQVGHRLQYMELLNWGTFNGKIWRITPEGENSLLTGAVGSGKSTVVDALTSLLVPHQRITFNKAAGAESRERNLASYIKGNYSSKSDELTNGSKAVTLRYTKAGEATFTAIVANFRNTGYETNISLAQLFWIENGGVRKLLLIGNEPLTIKEHLSGFTDVKELKKRLRANKSIEIFDDNFARYSQRFRQLFGMNSDKAIELFYQTVSMKSVSSLTNFVREQMLERTNIQEQIEELKKRFDNLHQAHAAVMEARKQRDILSPLTTLDQEYSETRQQLQEIEFLLSDAIPTYFADKKLHLLQKEIATCQRKLTQLDSQFNQAEQELDNCRNSINDLRQAIRENGGDRLEQIKKEIEQATVAQQEKKRQHERYLQLTVDCGIPAANTEQTFFRNQKTAEDKQEEIQAEREKTTALQGEKIAKNMQTEQEIKLQKQEIESLQKRSNQLPSGILDIRNQLVRHLGIREEEIPFVGELLKVRSEDKEWEGALERLLHGFGISMLVPDRYYHLVSGFVNTNRLQDKFQKGVRLEYFRVPAENKLYQIEDVSSESVINKIDIKPNTPFYNWLEKELVRRFDLQCVSLEEFRSVSDGITKEGQIKTGRLRHVKDDRRDLWDRRNFILGWNNKEKIRAIESYLQTLQKQYKTEEAEINNLSQMVNHYNTTQSYLQEIKRFRNWNELNWQGEIENITRLQEEERQITDSNDLINTLKEQQQQAEKKEKELKEQYNQLRDNMGRQNTLIELATNQLPEQKTLSASLLKEDKEIYYPKIDLLLQNRSYTLHSIDNLKGELIKSLGGTRLNIQKKSESTRDKITKIMREYRYAFPFDALELAEDVEACAEYLNIYHRVVTEGLPAHEARLKAMLNQDTIQSIVTFDSKLDLHAKQIQEKIGIINTHLEAIEFNKGTYIKLQAVTNPDREIMEFKENLKACYSNILNTDDAYTEERFEQVQQILNRFRSNENRDIEWTGKVTDVRQWFLFNASERYRADDMEKEFYAGTSGKSGGQKEKLAYTILASALAYQFGLNYQEERSKSFRFVVIDEAFGRGDDESTQFGLDLFKKLNLQLLIVTPMQKIHVIENYIRSVHYVSNPGGNDSQIRNLSIEEYRKEKTQHNLHIEIVS
ncbi:ATP-binding protein [uncultured Parabacteroides sp.]|uniref:ATP-binding protein n=1 Tax=uncultured Parabacteroides sp. TaxID=512312 RepID=UPI00259B0B87|nr:ATP-binding protein [uncultured Parabacteroides sp.]